jgi:hypothetical protein
MLKIDSIFGGAGEEIGNLEDLRIDLPSLNVLGTDSSASAIHDIDVRNITANRAGIVVRQKLMRIRPLRNKPNQYCTRNATINEKKNFTMCVTGRWHIPSYKVA